MPTKSLEELQSELAAVLRAGTIQPADRPLLEQVQADLTVALAKSEPDQVPHTLREKLQEAVERFEVKHPDLTIMLSKALDTLRDLGL